MHEISILIMISIKCEKNLSNQKYLMAFLKNYGKPSWNQLMISNSSDKLFYAFLLLHPCL